MDTYDKYLNLYCYSEYLKYSYRTNKLKHYELIWINEGFVLPFHESPQKMDREIKMENIKDEQFDELFNQLVNASIVEKETSK